MRLTRSQLISDLEARKPLIGDHDFGLNINWKGAYKFSLIEIVHNFLNPESDKDIQLFAEMALWCFDNCNDKWYLSWNVDVAYFKDEMDLVAFKLRWL